MGISYAEKLAHTNFTPYDAVQTVTGFVQVTEKPISVELSIPIRDEKGNLIQKGDLTLIKQGEKYIFLIGYSDLDGVRREQPIDMLTPIIKLSQETINSIVNLLPKPNRK